MNVKFAEAKFLNAKGLPSGTSARRFNRAGLFAAALALSVGGVALTGCTSSNDQLILDKLDQMQTEIDGLKGQQPSSGGSSSASSAGASGTVAGSSSAASANGAQGSSAATASGGQAGDFSARLADISQRVDGAVADAEGAAVPDAYADRRQAFIDAKAPIEALDRELDVLDDEIERAYRQGSLTQDEFWSLDKEVDGVEHRLDTAEDGLELRMGVDD